MVTPELRHKPVLQRVILILLSYHLVYVSAPVLWPASEKTENVVGQNGIVIQALQRGVK